MSDRLFDDLHAPRLADDAIAQLGIGAATPARAADGDAEPERVDVSQVRRVKGQLLQILRIRGTLTRAQVFRCWRAEHGELVADSFLSARFSELLAGKAIRHVRRVREGRFDVYVYMACERP